MILREREDCLCCLCVDMGVGVGVEGSCPVSMACICSLLSMYIGMDVD